jgi:hypothetical protein
MGMNKLGSRSLPLRNNFSSDWVRGLRLSDAPASEKALAIFQTDILIPNQFRSTYTRTFHLESEKLLMLAVLWDAVACFQANLGAIERRKQQLFIDAEQWIWDSDQNYLFSFENICALLELEPGCVRRGLMAWKEMALAKRAAQSVAS